MAGEAKNDQHTVSRFYLKGFCSQNGQLWEYARSGAPPRRTSAKNATTQYKFYSIQRPDGTWDDSIEDDLQVFECCAAQPLRRLADGHVPSPREKWNIAYFLALCLYRVSALKQHADDVRQRFETVEATLNFIEKSRQADEKRYGREVVTEVIEEIRRRGRGIQLPQQYHLAGLDDYARGIAVRFMTMAWEVQRAHSPHNYITSDQPVFVRRPTKLDDPGIVGVAYPGAEVCFPLDQTAFLIIRSGSSDEISFSMASKSRVEQLNKRTIVCAHEAVFAPARSDYIRALVAECCNSRVRFAEFNA